MNEQQVGVAVDHREALLLEECARALDDGVAATGGRRRQARVEEPTPRRRQRRPALGELAAARRRTGHCKLHALEWQAPRAARGADAAGRPHRARLLRGALRVEGHGQAHRPAQQAGDLVEQGSEAVRGRTLSRHRAGASAAAAGPRGLRRSAEASTSAGVSEPPSRGDGRHLREEASPSDHLELGEERLRVRLDGLRSDPEIRRDLIVGEPAQHRATDVLLAS